MLKIREEQLGLIGQAFEQQFVQEMVEHLDENFREPLAARDITEDDLEDFVNQGIAKARDFGFDAYVDTRVFLECMVLLGPDFDEDSRPELDWVRAVLRNDEMKPAEKAEALNWQLLSAVDWEHRRG